MFSGVQLQDTGFCGQVPRWMGGQSYGSFSDCLIFLASFTFPICKMRLREMTPRVPYSSSQSTARFALCQDFIFSRSLADKQGVGAEDAQPSPK